VKNMLIKEIRTLPIPYILGLPIIIIMLVVLQGAQTEAFDLLRRSLLIIFGYIAAVIDVRSKRIPNKLVITMLIAWVLIMTSIIIADIEYSINRLADSVLGFALGGGIFVLVYAISRKGLGGGDVKFMAASGLYLGVGGVLPAIFIGTVLAALVGLVLILTKKIKRKDPIPLAPFLFAGVLITIFLS